MHGASVSRQIRQRRVDGKRTAPTLLQACRRRFMAGGASGAAGGRAAGRTEGRSRTRRLSSWRAIPLLLAWSRRAHEAERQVQRSPCIDDAQSFFEAARKPAGARPVSGCRQPYPQPPPVVCTARASVRSAGGGRSAPWRSRRRPHSRLNLRDQKQGKDVLALGLRRGGGPKAAEGRRAWGRFVCVVADVVVVRRLSDKRP